MAKELPYFQFEPAQYLTGNIQFCSLEAQGLFINICAIYWQRECNLTLEQINKKFNKSDLVSELIDNDVIKTHSSIIDIEFLDEQFETITKSKSRLSEAGRKGALVKKQATVKPPLSDALPTLKQLDNIREDKIIEDISITKNNLTEQMLDDLENSTHIELVCKRTELSLDKIKAKIPEFKKIANIEYAKPMDLVMHFIRWVNQNKKVIDKTTMSLQEREDYMRNDGKM